MLSLGPRAASARRSLGLWAALCPCGNVPWAPIPALLPAAGARNPSVFWRVFLSLLTGLRVHRWAVLGAELWLPGPAGKTLALISPRLLSGRVTALWGMSRGCREVPGEGKREGRAEVAPGLPLQQPGGLHVNLRGAEQRETGRRKWKKQWISQNTVRCSLLLVRCGACFVE